MSVNNLKLSPSGRAFIESNEARRYTAYQDEAGVWTNGIGHTGPDVLPGQIVSDAQVDAWFVGDVAPDEQAVNSLVTYPLTQDEFDALVSFTFNVGVGGLKKSTLLRLLNSGHPELVHDQLLVWNKITDARTGDLVVSQGLVNRRMKEAALFDKGIVPVEIATLPASGVVPEPAPDQHPTLRSSKTLWAQGTAFFGVIFSFVADSAGDIGNALKDSASDISGLVQYSAHIKFVFLAISGIAVVLTFYERMRKLRIGK